MAHADGRIAVGDAAIGKPGVCCLITGPGLLNAATPIGQAYSDSCRCWCSAPSTPRPISAKAAAAA